MEKERKGNGPPPESIILALLYKWTLVGRPDPITDLAIYGFSRRDFLCVVAGLVKEKIVTPEKRTANGGADNIDLYEIVPIWKILTHPEKFREAYVVTRDIGMPRLEADKKRYNMIFGIDEQINLHIRR